MQFLANCLHDLAALGPGGIWALMGALFIAGLAGGATHCAGMCAPFVLAQCASGAERHAGGGMLARLSGAALLPYQAGRLIGYSLLGGLAGMGVGLATGRWRVLLAALLLGAAALMLVQAVRGTGLRIPAPRLPAALQGRIGALLDNPTGWRGVLLGLLLSALPCGLLYAALVAAAGSGSALGGALGMAACAAGTVPGLVGVALLGRLFARRFGAALGRISAGLFALNAVVLAVIAYGMLG